MSKWISQKFSQVSILMRSAKNSTSMCTFRGVLFVPMVLPDWSQQKQEYLNRVLFFLLVFFLSQNKAFRDNWCFNNCRAEVYSLYFDLIFSPCCGCTTIWERTHIFKCYCYCFIACHVIS